MRSEVTKQRTYWNSNVGNFDSIYNQRKNPFWRMMDKVFRWDMYARYEFTLEKAHPIENRTFLDVGCGTGRYSIAFAERGAKQVLGIDIATGMIETAQKLAVERGVAERVHFDIGELLTYPLNRKFDVCIGIGLFDYVREPLPLLSKMSNSAQTVIASFPRLWTWRAPVRKVRLSIQGCDVFFYTKSEIEKLSRDAGFSKVQIQTVGKLFCAVFTK